MRDLVNDAREMGITVYPPNINLSEWFFTVPDEKTLQFGLGAIKGMGQNIAEDIINERNRNGSYLDIFDLAARVPSVNRKTLEQLVRSGAFDCISEDRGLLFGNIPNAISAAQTVAASIGQASLFADENGQAERIVNWIEADSWTAKRKYAEEREAFGFALTGMVFDAYRKDANRFTTPYKKLREGKGQVTIAGQLVDTRVILGKRGKFAIITLSDGIDKIDAFAYGDVYERYRANLQPDEVLFLKGRVRLDKLTQKMSLTVDELMTIERWRHHLGAVVRVLAQGGLDKVMLKDVLSKYQGDDKSGGVPVILSLNSPEANLQCEQILIEEKILPVDSFKAEALRVSGVLRVDFVF